MNTTIKAWITLVRLDRPAGLLLLFWPTMTALWLAARGMPEIKTLLVFAAGVVLMRSAGCAINDYFDRDIDAQVFRTKDRPLASGKLSPRTALVTALVLCFAAFCLVCCLNRLCVMYSFAALAIAASYPLFKRFFALPQAWLGIAFGFGIPMAYAAVAGSVPVEAWVLLAANVCWTLSYDTVYAISDREDDLKLGLKTSAITFGRYDVVMCGVFSAAMLVLVLAVFVLAGCSFVFGIFWAAAALVQVSCIRLASSGTRAACLRAFSRNNLTGAAIFAGTVVQGFIGWGVCLWL